MTIPASHHHEWYQCGIDKALGIISYPVQTAVKILGQDAACYGDVCQCHSRGHTTLIAEGAAKVLIEGKPAARLGVKTVDGGAVLWGEWSVLIGGEAFSLPACITIQGDIEFQKKVLADLYKIGTTKSGQLLFADMQASGKKCTICPGPGPHTHSGSVTYSDPMLEKPRELPFVVGPNEQHPETYDDVRAADGTGIDAKIYFSPENGDTFLFHEGVHANDTMRGTLDENPYANPGGEKEQVAGCERKATGLPPYQDQPYSQNTYNKERGYPQLTFYGRPASQKKKP